MNAPIDTIVAESTHSRVDWGDPLANTAIQSDTPVTVLRTAEGKWIAVEDTPIDELPAITEPITLIQRMKSSNLRHKCVVWAQWDGVRKAGFWDTVPARMPLYKTA